LQGHQQGKTWEVILDTLQDLVLLYRLSGFECA
jgi:DNA (cytosine-5)-methyltransferase 1